MVYGSGGNRRLVTPGRLFLLTLLKDESKLIIMKEQYKQRLKELAHDLVTPERFKPDVAPGIGLTVVRLTQMQSLPDNLFLLERESNYRLDEPPDMAA